jgi:nicotinamide-nucleotide amidase
MSAEIICVGTELLLGEILNSNARYLAQELARLGIPHYHQNVVGDNPQRIQQVMEIAIQRSRILIFTGGLGPTPDDLTTSAIAQFFDTPLIEDPDLIADIAHKFASRGREMTPNNRKQALLPKSADVLPNRTGTAPGMIWQPQDNLTILTFPGVPSELKQMWLDTAVPYLQQQGWGHKIIYSRTLRFWGIGESALATKVNDFFDLTTPTVAPYASKGEVRLRIATQAGSESEAMEVIRPVEQEIRQIAGEDCFGTDDDTLASVVGQLLIQSNQTLSVAESCTGGGLGAMLTQVSGSSHYFKGGMIAYANEVKQAFLGVKQADLEQLGAVSSVVAQQMAQGVRKKLGTDWGIGITGIAGPGGGTEEKPVGLVYIGLANPQGNITSWEYRFGMRSRDLIRHLSSCHALDRLRRALLSDSRLLME